MKFLIAIILLVTILVSCDNNKPSTIITGTFTRTFKFISNDSITSVTSPNVRFDYNVQVNMDTMRFTISVLNKSWYYKKYT